MAKSVIFLHKVVGRTFRKQLLAASLLALTGCGGGSSPAASIPVTAALPLVDISSVTLSDPGSSLPVNWQHGAFIEIFVRSYQDSDGNGKGDLRGLIQRLDYLQDLGVKGIWLMPVSSSSDHDHGYAVSDYRGVESDYGSLADFDELLKQAHARGIGVIVDYVINHSSAQNPLFSNSRDAASNAYRNWYIWQDPPPSGWSIYGGNPWRATGSGAYFGPFSDQMPDFNLLNSAVVDYHKSNLRFWLNRGVDGFRFDAVGNLVESGPSAWENQPRNYSLMGEMRSLLNGYAQRYMVCEAPTDPAGFAAGSACGSAFAFNLQTSLLQAAKGQPSGVLAMANYFKTASSNMATMFSNHDLFAGQRLWDQVGGNSAQYKLAAASYLLLPGTPFIYYGEEIGMSGATNISDDGRLRTPMSWTANTSNAGFSGTTPYRALSGNVASQNVAAQAADPNSILAFYKAMLKLRNSLPSLAQGSYEQAFASGNLLGYQRLFAKERTLVLINYGDSAVTAVVASLPANAALINAYPVNASDATADAAGLANITIAAQSLRVFSLR